MASETQPTADEPRISVERLAELHASIERGEEVSGLLRAQGITDEEWRSAVTYHLTALGDEIRAGGRELCDRYLRASRGSIGSADKPALIELSAPIVYFETEHTAGPVSVGPITLPFRKGTQWVPNPTSPAESTSSGETLAVNPNAATTTELPFESAVLELLKLDRYVEMAAALRNSPESANAIMASFGLLTNEQCERLHNLWHLRFQANAELRTRFLSEVEERCEAASINKNDQRKDEP